MSQSIVYLIRISNDTKQEVREKRFLKLLKDTNILDAISPKNLVAVKLTFGEKGNDNYIRAG